MDSFWIFLIILLNDNWLYLFALIFIVLNSLSSLYLIICIHFICSMITLFILLFFHLLFLNVSFFIMILRLLLLYGFLLFHTWWYWVCVLIILTMVLKLLLCFFLNVGHFCRGHSGHFLSILVISHWLNNDFIIPRLGPSDLVLRLWLSLI